MNRFDRKYRRIAKGISTLDITSNFYKEDLSWDDLFLGDNLAKGPQLFLGKYSLDGIKFIIERFGLDRQARQAGIRHLHVQMDTSDPYKHTITIYSGDRVDHSQVVMEFVARYQHLKPKSDEAEFKYTQPLRVLLIEWLLLQNPRQKFTDRRPRLPGQAYPGLGLGDELMALFTLMGRHLQVDGIVNVPQYFHTGLLFGKRFLFLRPTVQAQVQQIARDLWKKYRLGIIAWASATGAIYEIASGQPFLWEPRRQIIPLQSQLRHYFKSPEYVETAGRIQDQPVYAIDEVKLKSALAAMDDPPLRL